MALPALLLLTPLGVRAQEEGNRLDATGRQNLTLGSGARAYGMGGAFLARADDATAASWNPAGLSYLRLPELSLAGASNSFRIQSQPEKDRFSGRSLDFGAFTWPVTLGAVGGAVQVSYQRAISFDGERRIESLPEDGNWHRDEARGDGGFDVLALGLGLRVTRSLRAGFTVNRWLNGYSQSLTRTYFGPKETNRPLREYTLNFDPRGWSFNLGLMWSPVESLTFGGVYKTPFTAEVAIDKSRRDHWIGGKSDIPDQITTNEYSSESVRLKFPASYGLGLSWRPRDTVTLSADVTRTRWSQARILNYFELKVTGPTDTEGVPPTSPAPFLYDPLQYPTQKPVSEGDDPNDPLRVNGQQDAQQIRFGVEWVLIKGDVRLPLRAGYFNDRQIERDASGHIPRLNGFTVGAGIAIGSLLLDVAYVYEHGAGYATVTPSVSGDSPGLDVAPTLVPRSNNTTRAYASVIYRFGGRH